MFISTIGIGLPVRNKAAAADTVATHWASKQLAAWQASQHLQGDENGLRPDDPVTRGELLALINRSFQFTATTTVSFTDLSASNWVYPEVAKAVKEGYIQGYEDGTIRTESRVSREEIAVIAERLIHVPSTLPQTQSMKFIDFNLISSWSHEAVSLLTTVGIMDGYEDGSFGPDRALTRAEAIVILERVLSQKNTEKKIIYDKPGIYGPSEGKATLTGNVIISSPGVTLQNTSISGDLTVADTVGEGDVFLKNLSVEGKTIINGGGEHSIHLEDSIMLTIIVDKRTGGVRIVANGATVIEEIQVQSSVNLEADGITGQGIGVVTLSEALPQGSQVNMVGKFETLNVLAKSIVVEIPKGSIDNLNVGTGAAQTKITTSKEASILSLILNAAVSVLGEAKVMSAIVNASGVLLEKQPDKLDRGSDLPEDAKITIGGTESSIKDAVNSKPPLTPAPSNSTPGNDINQPDPVSSNLPTIIKVREHAIELNESQLNYYSATVTMSIYIDALVSVGDEWQITLGGSTYKIGLWNDATNERINIPDAQAFGSNLVLKVMSVFSYPGSFSLKLYTGSPASPVIAASTKAAFPLGPSRLRVTDHDNEIGFDGRDITINWEPPIWKEAVKQTIYVVPASISLNSSNISSYTPVFESNDMLVRTWTGSLSTLDSTGTRFSLGKTYVVYLLAGNSGEIMMRTQTFKPMADLSLGPDPLVLPGPSDPKPIVELLALGSVTTSVYSYQTRVATVGDIVYGQSNQQGYLYLVPTHISKSIIYLDLAVSEGLGIRQSVSANQQVSFNTSLLTSREYKLVGVGNNNAINQTEWRLRLNDTDESPLAMIGSTRTNSTRTISINFNKDIYNTKSDIDKLKELISISIDGSNYVALNQENLVELKENSVSIKFVNPLPADSVQLKLSKGSVVDRVYNPLEVDLVIPVDFGPSLTIVSSAPYKVGNDIIVKTDRPSTVYLVPQGVSGTQLDFENAVVSKIARKVIIATSNTEGTLSTTGLEPGSYSILVWTGGSQQITLIP
jgi:hypothetical protein